MARPGTLENTIEALIAVSAAISNLRLYPPSSPMIGNATDRAYGILQNVIAKEGSIIFARSEEGLAISGQALAEKDQGKPQVEALSQLMVDFGVKSIAFEEGLDRDELLTFLQVMSRKPEDIAEQGGLEGVLSGRSVMHVRLDGDGHDAVDEDRPVPLAGEDMVGETREERAVEPAIGGTGSGINVESLKEVVNKPGMVAKLLDASIQRLADPEEAASSKRIPKMVVHIINSLGEVVDDTNREAVLMQIVDCIVGMDEETLSMILAQNAGGDLWGGLYANLVDQLDDGKLEGLSARIRQIEDSAIAGSSDVDAGKGERRSGRHRRATHSLENLLEGQPDRRTKRDQRKSRLMHVQAGLNSILRGEEDAFLDRQVMLSVPTTVEQLLDKGKGKIAESIIDRLGDGLRHSHPQIRAEASAALAHINYNFASKHRTEEMLEVSHRLTEWIGFETTVSPSYSSVCGQLKAVIQALIRSHRFGECAGLLETFHLIRTGKIEKNQQIRSVSDDVLVSIAKEDILNLLLQESETDEKGFGEQAATILSMIGGRETAATAARQTEQTEETGDELAQQMKLVDRQVQQEGTESAVKMLLDLVARYAKEEDFSRADSFREKLLEVDPMALTEIVESADIIEKAKREAIGDDHLALWKEIYNTLNLEETNALYHAMESETYEPGQAVFSQGKLDSRLCFIEAGQIKIVFHHEGEEHHIRDADPGDIVGADCFFQMTVRTSSAVAGSAAKVRSLGRESLEEWKTELPSLASKLSDYCLGLATNGEALKKKGVDRRAHGRTRVQARISVKTLDGSGSPTGQAMVGTLADISEGGLSFYVRLPKERAESLLMGPKLNMQFVLPTGGTKCQMDLTGTAVAVRHQVDVYSISVKFHEMLDSSIIKGIDISGDLDDEILEMEEATG